MGFVVFCYRNTLSMSFSRRRALSLLAAGISLPVTLGGLAAAGVGRAASPPSAGGYIYEYGATEGDYGMASGRRLGRIPEPAHDIVTLADYRTRYAQYRRDPDLQAAHARAPWISVWDDHEVANDTWVGGAENHHEDCQGRFFDREAAAVRAYYEWMPIREPARTRVAELVRYASFDVPFDLDGWDGYPAARERVYDAIKGATLKNAAGVPPGEERGANTIIVSGDSHAFWVNELRDAGGQIRVVAEFGTSSITSPSPGDELGGIQLGPVFVDQNPEVKFCDQLAKGYVLLTLTPEKAVADLVSVDIHAKPYTASILGSWQIKPTPGIGVAAPERV